MTQERNDEVEPRPADEDAVLASETSMSEDERVEAAEIRADIEYTRAEMGGTLNELGDRLEPGHLIDQAKENVREATIGRVEETSAMVMETISRNPIPAALAGIGLFMLWKNRSTGSSSIGRDQYRYRAYGLDRDAGYAGSMGATDGPDIGTKAREAAGTVGDAVGSAAGGAQQAAGQAIDRAGQAAQEVGWRLDSFMQANPIAVGVVAVGAGAAIGSLVPETPQEREMLGDASRQVSQVVREKVDEATTKAEETLDRAEEKVSSPA